MRFTIPNDSSTLSGYLPRFADLVGRDRWDKRMLQLSNSAWKSPASAKIVDDYHWLEMSANERILADETLGDPSPKAMDLPTLASAYFAATVVETFEHLGTKGQPALAGRLRDCINAETGFASLYLEMDVAQQLMNDGFEVSFADLDGDGQFDIAFDSPSISGEVECKSLSMDAGRRIHRKDFYRFVEAIGPTLIDRVMYGAREVVVITVENRLLADTASQRELRRSTKDIFSSESSRMDGSFFGIEILQYDSLMSTAETATTGEFYRILHETYGENCHAYGANTQDSCCIIVMRSAMEDDTSKPVLESMRKAATQLSGNAPGFIAIQFHDIVDEDLLKVNFRRRMAILAYALYGHYGATHVNSTRITGYGLMTATTRAIGSPGFGIPNMAPKFALDNGHVPTLLGHIADGDFADLLGQSRPTQDISFISFD